MVSFLSRVFSDRYVNEAAIGSNLLLLAMYRFAYPFSVLLIGLRLSPNFITTLSLLSALLAALALALAEGTVVFAVFWGLTVLLDFCDGTVARITGRVRRTAFRYDHFSDLIKIFLVILGGGFRYDNTAVWCVCLAASFCFMFYIVINHDLGGIRQRLIDTAEGRAPSRVAVSQRRSATILQALVAALLTINGHTMLVFFLLGFGEVEAMLGLTYFLALSALRAARCIHIMIGLPK